MQDVLRPLPDSRQQEEHSNVDGCGESSVGRKAAFGTCTSAVQFVPSGAPWGWLMVFPRENPLDLGQQPRAPPQAEPHSSWAILVTRSHPSPHLGHSPSALARLSFCIWNDGVQHGPISMCKLAGNTSFFPLFLLPKAPRGGVV